MKPFVKKEKSSSSTLDELATQRPKRSTSQKNTDGNNGLLWREETDLKKALYASLQETRKKNFEDEDEESEEVKPDSQETVKGQDGSPKKAKVHAQRKFAQGSTPTSPTPTPQKVPNNINSTTEVIPYRRPKTEDFLTFLCLRGTSILPPSLDFLNCCSKSDTSSDCRSLSPELEVTECSNTTVKVSASRDKITIKLENVPNGLSRKHTACKASSKQHPDVSLPIKKSKSNKEVSLVRKRKSRDECDIEFLPPNAMFHSVTSINSRTRSSTLHDLREKYKKQRLAAGKRKVLPVKSGNSPVPEDQKISNTKSQSFQKESKRNLPDNIGTRNKNKSQEVVTNNVKSASKDRKLAMEKRKSLRSAHFSKGVGRKRSTGLKSKTMWLRRAKLVPPIVDVDSDSEPEIISTSSEKKLPVQKVTNKPETSLIANRLSKRLCNQPSLTKGKTNLTSRQILLRKHMQNRLKVKKSILHSKNIKSKAIVKRSAVKQAIFKKERKNIGMKTMSLRKDLQNKRVTRSAKQQIEEMLWANPDKRAKGQIAKTTLHHKSDKKRNLSESPYTTKKQRFVLTNKNKDNKVIEHSDRFSKSKQLSNSDIDWTLKQTASKSKSAVLDYAKNTRSVKSVTSPIEERPSTSNALCNGVSQTKSKVAPLKSKPTIKSKPETLKSKIETSKSKLKTESLNLKIERSKSENSNLIEGDSNCKHGNNKSTLEKTKQLDPQSDNTKPKNEELSKAVDKSCKSITSNINLVQNISCSREDHKLSSDNSHAENLSSRKEASKLKTEPLQSDVPNLKVVTLPVEKVREKIENSNSGKAIIGCFDSKNVFFTNQTPEINTFKDPQINILPKIEMDISVKISKENNVTLNSNNSNKIHHKDNNFDLSAEFKELNVQNNLNLPKIEKANNKDISKLMTLNVEGEEALSDLICEPSTSGFNKAEINIEKFPCSNKHEYFLNKSQLFKKHNDKKYIKKSHSDDLKTHKKSLDRNQKLLTKNIEKSLRSPKDSSKEKRISKNHMSSKKDNRKLAEKNISKKEINRFEKESINVINDSMSDSDSSSTSSIERFSKVAKDSSKDKYYKKHHNSCIPTKSNQDKYMKQISTESGKNISNNSKCSDFSSNNHTEIQNFRIDSKCESGNKDERMKNFRKHSNKIVIDSDDSDNDLTIDQYLKLKNMNDSAAPKHKSCVVALVKKDVNQGVFNLSNDNVMNIKKEIEKASLKPLKEDSLIKKENDKDLQKTKREGISSKHKKDKDYSKVKSHEKLFKKEEKVNKKDAEKSLAKLLKKEKERDRSKSSKKDEKSKHKRDSSSSSKSSKRDFDKDGSKLRRESDKDNCPSEKQSERKVEFLEVKKDKITKKESSKISRSNSCDETKSPRKKKKYNELKGIEKIKNLISNSSILNEISGFKAFKRRLSSDKSELKKRLSKKKQKKLAMLKQKKLSKKLSSKLLRKYSKKKGLKSKKNKLKRKEHKKELKMSNMSKIHSRNKKQKHKMKEHRRDSQDKIKNPDSTSAPASKSGTSRLPDIPLFFAKQSGELPNQETQINLVSSNNVHTSTNDIGTSSPYVIKNVSDIISSVETTVASTDISQTICSDLLISSSEELPVIATSEFTGVFEEGCSASTIVLTRDNISQVPVHFVHDIPKTMADAATNTCEEDIDEIISSIPDHLKNEEMSVGTQTMTPAGSPSPTLEVRPLITSVHEESTLIDKSNKLKIPSSVSLSNSTEILMSSTSTISKKVPLPLLPGTLNMPLHPTLIDTKGPIPKTLEMPLNTVAPDNSKKAAIPTALDVPSSTTSPTTFKKILPKDEDVHFCTSASINPKKANSVNKTSQPLLSKVKKRTVIKKLKAVNKIASSSTESFPLDTAKMVAAPVYRPSSEEFQDPLEYISRIYLEAEQYGICKIIPPSSFKPECKVNDDLRFMALNQYLHKMLYRWGPNVQHTACIKKHLKSQKVKLEQAPLIGGIELDISKFYHTVQQFGGLQQVIEKKKWQKVADVMRVPKAAQDRVTKLYDAYCKYLVSYDTLPSEEKQKLEEEVIAEHDRYVRLRNSSKDTDKEDDLEDEENPECVTKGRSMPLSNFFRIARNTMNMWFKNDHPLPEEVEHEFWKIATERNQHVVVHAGNIDSNTSQSGFPSNRSPFAKHPWNLKVLTNNNRSILRCMGPVSGITSPTLHVGMLFTTSCWYRDPHSLPWIEYLHTGADKIWYGIPANGSGKFKIAMKKIVPEYCIDKPLWLSSESSMIPPDLLVKHGSSLSRTIQKSGQFVVIFPESFTSTICCGYCVSESVYFAPTLWLDLAVKAFQDIHNSCESPAFSLERLLFSIANDPKPQLKALQRILPMIENIRTQEMNLRSQLFEIGLKQFEKLPVSDPRDKKKKCKSLMDENGAECEICSTPCYLSRVVYPQEDTMYCLPHALEHIEKKNLKFCKIMYSYDKKDFDDIIHRVSDLVSQLPKHSIKKASQKKKSLPISEK